MEGSYLYGFLDRLWCFLLSYLSACFGLGLFVSLLGGLRYNVLHLVLLLRNSRHKQDYKFKLQTAAPESSEITGGLL
jgi:hypothetical protein